jgi:hypothetical protein
LQSFPLGPGSRARDEEDEKTCDYAEDPVSFVLVMSIRHHMCSL